MKCKDCGNTSPALPGFPKHVFCNHYYLHMSNIADADRCEYFEQKPQTNYDRIVGLTPEGLADIFAGGCPNGDRLNCGKYYLHGGRDCFNCWLSWLNKEVGE